MPQTYITQAEQYILSFIAGNQFHAEDRQFYHDHVSPCLICDLLETYDYEDAIALLGYVIDRIDIRREKAKDRRLKYELLCYRSWLMNMRAQIEAAYAPEKAEERRAGFMEVVSRVLGGAARQQ